MRRSRITPATAQPIDWRTTIALPPAAAPIAAAGNCACDIVEVRWAPDGGTEITIGAEDETMIVAAGVVCHDTEWTLDVDWSEGSGEPTIVQLNAGAWRVTGGGVAGTLTITPAAVCGGVELAFDALVLHLESEA